MRGGFLAISHLASGLPIAAPRSCTHSRSHSTAGPLMAPALPGGPAALRDHSCHCRGFVGEGGSSVAGEYHSADFEWSSRVEEGEAALARQRQELAAWLEQQQAQQAQLAEGASHAARGACTAMNGAAAGATVVATVAVGGAAGGAAAGGSRSAERVAYDRGSWEGFHSQHSNARFFKERRYLLLEFPQLSAAHPPQHFAEIGCGCGSSLLPVLRANPTCRVTGCDISATAVRLFLEAAGRYGIDPSRVNAFAFDAALEGASPDPPAPPHPVSPPPQQQQQQQQPAESSAAVGASSGASAVGPLDGLGADAVLLIFTLSALPPDEMLTMLRHAWSALRPGGALLFRDYGRFDMAQLRFHGSQMLAESLYRRGDGTLAYFFMPEGMAQLAERAGFVVEESEYACVALRNRKKGADDMRRVFVHGVYRKPL